MVGTRVPAVRRRAPVLRHREDGPHSRRPAVAARSGRATSTSSPSPARWRSAAGNRTRGRGARTASRTDFGPELLQPDFDRFAPLAEAAAARIPMLNEVGIRQMINGPIPITADGEPIIGLSPELDNFYLCCGFTSGIAASGGAGWVMANWIVDGDPGLDLWPFDVRRFGAPHSVKQFMYDRAVESYGALLPHRVAELRDRRRPRRAAQPAARDAARARAPSTATSSAGSGPTGSRHPERQRSRRRRSSADRRSRRSAPSIGRFASASR